MLTSYLLICLIGKPTCYLLERVPKGNCAAAVEARKGHVTTTAVGWYIDPGATTDTIGKSPAELKCVDVDPVALMNSSGVPYSCAYMTDPLIPRSLLCPK